MQRVSLIIGIVIAVIALIVAIYFIFFRPGGPGLEAEPGNQFGEAGDFGGNPTGEGSVDFSDAVPETVAPRLVRITEGPVAYGVAMPIVLREPEPSATASTTGEAPALTPVVEVRYVERKSGHAYAYDTKGNDITRITNRTLPGIVEAAWAGDASTAFLRFLPEGADDISTYALPLNGGEEASGYLLEPGLDDVITMGSSTVITLLPSSDGSIATAARVDGASPRTIFSSVLSSLRLFVSGVNLVAVTKASSQMDGYAFFVDAKTGIFERALGPLRGLTVLPSPTGASVLFGYLSGNAAKAELLDATTREKTLIPLAALPEKCVWARDERSLYCAVPRSLGTGWPDEWYQGVASYSDRFWRIDLEARVASLVLDPATVADVAIDGVSLAIDEQSDYLVFTNKKDGSLWAYDL